MTNHMHPPADRRCQIYDYHHRCANNGTHWVTWPHSFIPGTGDMIGHAFDNDVYSWECDGNHHFGEAA